jgi:FkbM family methyltransferase
MLPVIHSWQWFWDYSRGTLPHLPNQIRERLRDFRYGRNALRQAVPILRDVHGIRFVLYPCDRPRAGRLVRRPSDVAEFRAVRRLVHAGAVAIDIGANVGIYSVLLSRLCGPDGRVWAFEPVPDTYWRLVETLALNHCENVVPLRTAICERSAAVRMNLFEQRFAEWNTLGNPSMPLGDGKRLSPEECIEVQSKTLDLFCAEKRIERINFLKVDVEGFEWAVFRGADRLLRDGRIDYICFEISQDPLKGAGSESRRVFEELEIRGYLAYRFDIQAQTFRGPVRDTSEYWTNFFASRTDLSLVNGTDG